MQKRNLKDSISSLKKLRNMHYSQLDISVVTELDTVIAELEIADGDLTGQRNVVLGLRALQVLGAILSIVSNINDYIK